MCSDALTAELSATPDSPPCGAAACVRCTLRLHSTLPALLKSLRIVLLQAATALMGGAAVQQRAGDGATGALSPPCKAGLLHCGTQRGVTAKEGAAHVAHSTAELAALAVVQY